MPSLTRILDSVLPLAGAIITVVAFFQGSNGVRIAGFEIAIVFLGFWLLGRSLPSVVHRPQRFNITYRSIAALEYSSLTLAFVSLLFSSDYTRPFAFFIFTAAFYSGLLLEALNSSKPSIRLFIMKLVIGQFIFIQSFAFLYPGFVASDSYIHSAISQSILANAGGLPKPFTSVVWYDATPMLSLLNAIGNLLLGAPLRSTYLVFGFVVPMMTVISVGAIVTKITSNTDASRIAMLVGCLISRFWVWSTAPIPEALALLLVTSCVVFCLVNNSKALFALSILIVGVVFTHGVMALVLILTMLAIYLFTRSRAALYSGLTSILVFATYSVITSIEGAEPGIATFWYGLLELLSKGYFPYQSSSLGQAGSIFGNAEIIIGTYWWFILSALAWLGLVELVCKDSKYKRFALVLTLIGGISFVGGISSGVLVTQIEAERYLGLAGYPLVCIPVSIGLTSLLGKLESKRRVVLFVFIFLFVFNGVASPSVSSDLWQDAGQGHYAALNRIASSTTTGEVASQNFVNNFDSNYYVVSNYLLEFVNITNPHTTFVLSNFPETGYTQNSISGLPRIVVISTRADALSFPSTNPSANVVFDNYDVVYSNLGSISSFLFS